MYCVCVVFPAVSFGLKGFVMDFGTEEMRPGIDRKKVLIIAGVAVLAIGLVVSLCFHIFRKEQVAVPSLTYMTEADARSALAKVGLTVGSVEHDQTDKTPEGYVLSQDPAAETVVDKDSEVTIHVSRGLTKIAVPDLIGLSPEEAEKVLFESWLVPSLADGGVYSDEVEPGRVCTQSVPAGTEVDVVTTEVVYQVSLGKERVKMLNVVGKKESEARSAMEAAGLSVDVNRSYSDGVPAGVVMEQAVAEGTELDKGTAVILTVSLGVAPKEHVNVPNVLTYKLDDARKTIEAAGLQFDYDGDVNGTVVGVNPNIGSDVEVGSVIKVTLHAQKVEPEKVSVPDVRGDNEDSAKKRLENVGLRYEVKGDLSGIVDTVDPAPNSMVEKNTIVKLTFVRNSPAITIVSNGTPNDDGDNIDDNDLTTDDLNALVDIKGLGTFVKASLVIGDDNVEYWDMVCRNANGEEIHYYVNPDGNILS